MVNRMRREEARVNYCKCQSLKYITLSFCYFVRSMGLRFEEEEDRKQAAGVGKRQRLILLYELIFEIHYFAFRSY